MGWPNTMGTQLSTGLLHTRILFKAAVFTTGGRSRYREREAEMIIQHCVTNADPGVMQGTLQMRCCVRDGGLLALQRRPTGPGANTLSCVGRRTVGVSVREKAWQ
jgi:hypothetical protein